MQSDNYAFLSLVRLGIGHHADALSENVDWSVIQDLAMRQGLSAIILDGIEQLPECKQPPQLMLLTWIGRVMQGYEVRYAAYCRAVVELAAFYNVHGYKMMLLKGLACGRDWPKPEHRPYGDIDIWMFGKQKESDAVMESFSFQDSSFKGIKIDRSHHHHTVFNWMGFTVENHYDFVNVHAHRLSWGIEKVFKFLGQDDSHYFEMESNSTGSATMVYLPSTNLHALFLMKHMAGHFAAVGITMRQVLDWAFFVEKNTKEINWSWLKEMLNRYGMAEFFNTVIAICIEDLDFDKRLFPICHHNPEMKEKVLAEILCPQFSGEMPSNLFVRVIWKYRRWRANAWKHKLCYKESLWSAFWSGVWNHLLKPSSI